MKIIICPECNGRSASNPNIFCDMCEGKGRVEVYPFPIEINASPAEISIQAEIDRLKDGIEAALSCGVTQECVDRLDALIAENKDAD